MKNCIALITKEPNLVWLDFLNTFKELDVYLIIDENTLNYKEIYNNKYPTINFIQLDNKSYSDRPSQLRKNAIAFDDKNCKKKESANQGIQTNSGQ
jgi:hypothetical protein